MTYPYPPEPAATVANPFIKSADLLSAISAISEDIDGGTATSTYTETIDGGAAT